MLANQFIDPVLRLLAKAPERRVIDLCSGGAGPWLSLLSHIPILDGFEPVVTLTDISPNIPAMERARTRSSGRIDFVPDSVDAGCVPDELRGARTIFNGFHHLPPAKARNVLTDAAVKGQPIGIFEMVARTWYHVLTGPLVSALVLATTPLIRPFRPGRLFWTYAVPVMPTMLFWDGLVSSLRVYSASELEELTRGIDAPHYQWEIDQLSIGPVRVPYLLGYPVLEESKSAR